MSVPGKQLSTLISQKCVRFGCNGLWLRMIAVPVLYELWKCTVLSSIFDEFCFNLSSHVHSVAWLWSSPQWHTGGNCSRSCTLHFSAKQSQNAIGCWTTLYFAAGSDADVWYIWIRPISFRLFRVRDPVLVVASAEFKTGTKKYENKNWN